MYSNTLEDKINKMFSEVNFKVLKIIQDSQTSKIAIEKIEALIFSETRTRSKTMLSDMYMILSKEFLESLDNSSQKNIFYEMNLHQKFFENYSFKLINKNIKFTEYNSLKFSLIGSFMTFFLGYLFKSLLSINSNLFIFILPVIVFCVLYFKVIKDINKKEFNNAINVFIKEAKIDYINWFDEVEKYFYRCVKNIKRGTYGRE